MSPLGSNPPGRPRVPAIAPAVLASLAAFALGGLSAAGCSGDGDTGTGGTTTTTTTGGDGGAGGEGGSMGGAGGTQFASKREMFEKTVQPGLVENCKACHENFGIADFLALPDVYTSVTVYKSVTNDRPLLWPVPEESILYAYPDSADHNGKTYGEELADLKANVLAWLKKEAETLPPIDEENAGKTVVPFKPIMGGFNAIYLDSLGKGFESSAITFIAEELGSPPSILRLSKLEVYPAGGVALRLVHPRFVVFPAEGTEGYPDPADSLSDVDKTFIAQEDPKLSTGELLLTNWEPGARLGLDFTLGEIESLFLGSGGDIKVPCIDLGAFEAAVLSLGENGPRYCAENCHGGNKAEAKAAMDLSGLISDPPAYDKACAFMRSRIKPGDVEGSQIMIVTNPKQLQVVHMYKFNGNTNNYNAFKMGMTAWIMAE
jgi:hypothetical protein